MDFVFSGESGPSAGYLPGQSERITIRVGLPPNSVLMANPIAVGAVPWNGKNRDRPWLRGCRRRRHRVHQSWLCRHVHRYGSQRREREFVLNPDGTLNYGLIKDFADDGILYNSPGTAGADLLGSAPPQLLAGLLDRRSPGPLSGAKLP